jgi:CRISPR/Cas system-associated exonuclease Cas4 (RecB family)
MEENGIGAVPFVHKELEVWRDPFVGVMHTHKETGLVVSGGVDDVWIKPDGTLIIVDYKATSKEGTIETLADSSWEDQYKRQIGVYQWLFEKNGFTVDKTGYFVYANALQTEATFNNTLMFETTLVPCEGDQNWIEPKLKEIKACLESDTYPESGEGCEYCPYREACGKKLMKIHVKK